MVASSHSYEEYVAALATFTEIGVEVFALDTAGDDPPSKDSPHPNTLGGIQKDEHRWVWPAPKGYAFGISKSAPMLVKVIVTTGKAQESDWLGLEEVVGWAAAHPPIMG